MVAGILSRSHFLLHYGGHYVTDSSMNDIDVISRMQIEELLVKFQLTILFVEQDKAFCENVATKTVKLEGMV